MVLLNRAVLEHGDMATVQIKLPPKLLDVFSGKADYRGAYGGRGSGKTRNFAAMTAAKAIQFASTGRSGLIICAREYMNSLADSSFSEVRSAIAEYDWMVPYFDIGEKYIRTIDGSVTYAFCGLRRNISSIKSKSRVRLLWVDEAENVPESAWSNAINTVREDGAEIWVTWNPERETSATNQRFIFNPPSRSKIIKLNWQDNPFFSETLNRKRLDDLANRPETYDHVWEGDFVKSMAGAYFAKPLLEAKSEGRIGHIGPDPLMTNRAYWDIGGTGANADACAIWIVQFINGEIRVLDYYEAVGQPLASHVEWLRANGYGNAQCILPHDGAANDKVFATSYQQALRSAGFDVIVKPNMGKGAALRRIEAVRRVMPQVRFNEKKTDAGRQALGWYHEKRDDVRNIGYGPEHDWASHGADAFGLMAVDYLDGAGQSNRPVNIDSVFSYETMY